LYPSRYREIEQLFSRIEPVVYTPQERWCDAPAPLTQEKVAFYSKNGFLLLEDVFTAAEVEQLSHEAASLRQDDMLSRREETILEPDSSEIRSIFDIQRFSSRFRELV